MLSSTASLIIQSGGAVKLKLVPVWPPASLSGRPGMRASAAVSCYNRVMRVRGIAIGIFLLSGAAFGQTRPFDIQLSYGGWTLSPFRSVVERECEGLIRNEFAKLVGSAIPEAFLFPFLSNVDLSSSGHLLSLALWHRFGNSRFSAGVRGDYFAFRLPYSLSVEESFKLPGFPPTTLKGQGRGTVRLNGLAVSFLGRWTALSTRRLDLSLHGGLLLLPFQGDVSLDQTTALETPLGDISFSGRFDHTIDQVRDLGFRVPSLIVSPALGIELRCRLAAGAGIFIDATAAQGTFFTGGLFFSF
jgi:hypothetical protein